MSNKILVTGGLGYIGSHAVIELVENGYQPIIVDNLINSEIKQIDRISGITAQKNSFYKIDITKPGKLDCVFDEHKIDRVIHFAALKSVADSVKNPISYYQNNIFGLLNLISTMQRYNAKELVFSSSCTAYGNSEKIPYTEDAELKRPASPYGATKQMSEQIISDAISSGILNKAISLRYFNPIGAHRSGKLGELPLGKPSNFVPCITQFAAGLTNQLTIFGKDYPTKDGTCVRDYIHVTDLVKAHIVSLKFLEKQSSNYYDVFNLGTGKGTTNLELLRTFEKVNNISLDYNFGDRRPGDISEVFASVEKATKQLGWKHELSIEDALKDAWRWQQNIIKETT